MSRFKHISSRRLSDMSHIRQLLKSMNSFEMKWSTGSLTSEVCLLRILIQGLDLGKSLKLHKDDDYEA